MSERPAAGFLLNFPTITTDVSVVTVADTRPFNMVEKQISQFKKMKGK